MGFVGRDHELSLLRGAVRGDTRLLLIVGDAGVGKTRLVGEATRRLKTDGIIALWGRCLPLAEALPLLPIADMLAELNRKAPTVMEAALVCATAADAEETAGELSNALRRVLKGLRR